MKYRKAANEVLSSSKNVIKKGVLTEKILTEIKMTTSLYECIEVLNNYYTDPENPDFNNWIDVEGFGYGWAWSRWDENRWHEMMSKIVEKDSERLWGDTEDGYYIVSINDGVKVYHLIGDYGECRKDVVISFSNEELYY